MKMRFSLKKLAAAAAVGALYVALTMLLAPISYSPLPFFPVEFRVSEVLCILPFFFPGSAFGLFAGCLIANVLSPFGIIDVVFGSLATLLAGLCTAAIGAKARKTGKAGWGACIAACLMPVLFNGPIIGAVIAFSSTQGAFWESFVLNGAQIGLGEMAVMLALGLPAMRYLLRSKTLMGILESVR